jgi:hypothetical protein
MIVGSEFSEVLELRIPQGTTISAEPGALLWFIIWNILFARFLNWRIVNGIFMLTQDIVRFYIYFW